MAEKKETLGKDQASEKLEPCRVTFSSGDVAGTGTSTHFHEKGMLILCRNPLNLNDKVKLSLLFPGFKHPLEIQAEVVWTNVYGPADSFSPRGMGVKFLNLERDTERLLAELAGQYESFGSIYQCYYS